MNAPLEQSKPPARTPSQSYARAVLDIFPGGVAVVDASDRIIHANAPLLALLGYQSLSELVGRPAVETLLPPAFHERARGRVRKALEGQANPPIETSLRKRDGGEVPVESTSIPFLFDGQPVVVVQVRDLTERQRLTAQMMQVDRLIAAGTLAAGVGHEINNPLTYLIANLAFIAEELPGLGRVAAQAAPELAPRFREMEEMIAEAREGAGRVRNIVRDLKAFSYRPAQEKKQAIHLPRLLDLAINMAWNEIRHRAKLAKDFASAPPVMGMEATLGQVFFNLVLNAAQAIPEGNAEENRIAIRHFPTPDGMVCVEVKDSGCGIPPENMKRIFDPFFTTKDPGHGTGLGLSLSQATVQSLGGRITVESEVGRGSTFRVFLPVAAEKAAEPPRLELVKNDPAAPTRVLVIDDEPLLGQSVRRILAQDNEVEIALSGAEAIQRIEAGARYEVILCDLMMPDMTGMDVIEALEKKVPEQAKRVVVVTGGAFTLRAADFLAKAKQRRLEKPFEPEALRSMVRDVAAKKP